MIEPIPAAWLQVAPGKFVRVEPGSPTGESGPYATLPPGTPTTPPSPAEAEADPGPRDAPTEAALDHPHLETTPAEGPAPEGPRDPEPADAGWPLDDDARAESSAFGRDVTPDPGPRPVPGRPQRREEAGLGPIRAPEALATDDTDPAAGTQPEARVGGPVVVGGEGSAVVAERPVWDESGAEGDRPEPEPTAEDDANAEDVAADVEPPVADGPPVESIDLTDECPDEPGDPSHGHLSDAIGASYPGGAMAAWSGRGVPPPRWNVRPTRAPHCPNGLRQRSKRGDGRPHQFASGTFPSRLAPASSRTDPAPSTRC